MRDAVAEVRARSPSYSVVVVDPNSTGDEGLTNPKDKEYWSMLPKDEGESGADLVIKPQLQGVGFFDSTHRTAASFAGKQAVRDLLPDLKKLAGI
jgi:hypothetical protein